MVSGASLYFHSPCFDGITSALLTLDFLETSQDWKFEKMRSVDYDQRDRWLSGKQRNPFAVVDFLYHPDAAFWADHHQTSFLTPSLRKSFDEQKNPFHIYNSKSSSCAGLLWRTLQQRFHHQNSRYSELVRWADKIDAARYSSVKEAIRGSHPALRINRSLATNKDPDYPAWLVTRLRTNSLAVVGSLPEVMSKSKEAEALIAAGLERLSRTVYLEDTDIAVFDVDGADVLVNRYAPYHFFPKARYSLGMVRTPRGIKITAMRNPWRQFPSVYLGSLFERFGGGGHRRVGSVMLKNSDARDAQRLVKRLLQEIRKEESSNKKVVAA